MFYLLIILGLSLTLFGCSSNIEVEEVKEEFKSINEIRLYEVTGSAKGKVVLQELKETDGKIKYKMKFMSFTFPTCSGKLQAVLSGGSNNAKFEIDTTKSEGTTSDTVEPVTADIIMIKCDNESVGEGGSDSFISSGDGFIKGGKFENAGDHVTQGNMDIYRVQSLDANGMPTAKYVLRFENIEVDTGPDVNMYFTPSAGRTDVDESGTLMVALDGAEKGTFSKSGNFNQDAPDGFDPSKYSGVLIWCRQFGVPFGTLTFTKLPSSDSAGFLKGGEFGNAGDHKTSGKMKIYSENYIKASGSSGTRYVLRFEDILVDEGPDVALYFTPSAEATGIDEEGTYVVSIDGREKGTFSKSGDFSQTMPEDFDATKFKGALVWCRQVAVLFGTFKFTEFS